MLLLSRLDQLRPVTLVGVAGVLEGRRGEREASSFGPATLVGVVGVLEGPKYVCGRSRNVGLQRWWALWGCGSGNRAALLSVVV